MSAGTHAYVACDHRWCEARIDEGRTRAQARAVARKRGWLVQVRSSGEKPRRPSWGLWDFCPLHRPDKPQEAKTDA